MSKQNLSKQHLYDGVKSLVESEHPHVHLSQHKLYTLVSIGFQYMLYMSTKRPGAYIIRVENSHLLDKLCKRSKDSSTRKFLDNLAIPRRLKYGKSTFFLDYFQLSSWGQTTEIPKEKIQGALVIKNANPTPLNESLYHQELQATGLDLPESYYYDSLRDIVPKSVVIALESEFENVQKIDFPFIKKEERALSGVKISEEIDLE